MRKNIKNDKVIRAISIGLAAAMTLGQPMSVLAEEVETPVTPLTPATPETPQTENQDVANANAAMDEATNQAEVATAEATPVPEKISIEVVNDFTDYEAVVVQEVSDAQVNINMAGTVAANATIMVENLLLAGNAAADSAATAAGEANSAITAANEANANAQNYANQAMAATTSAEAYSNAAQTMTQAEIAADEAAKANEAVKTMEDEIAETQKAYDEALKISTAAEAAVAELKAAGIENLDEAIAKAEAAKAETNKLLATLNNKEIELAGKIAKAQAANWVAQNAKKESAALAVVADGVADAGQKTADVQNKVANAAEGAASIADQAAKAAQGAADLAQAEANVLEKVAQGTQATADIAEGYSKKLDEALTDYQNAVKDKNEADQLVKDIKQAQDDLKEAQKALKDANDAITKLNNQLSAQNAIVDSQKTVIGDENEKAKGQQTIIDGSVQILAEGSGERKEYDEALAALTEAEAAREALKERLESTLETAKNDNNTDGLADAIEALQNEIEGWNLQSKIDALAAAQEAREAYNDDENYQLYLLQEAYKNAEEGDSKETAKQAILDYLNAVEGHYTATDIETEGATQGYLNVVLQVRSNGDEIDGALVIEESGVTEERKNELMNNYSDKRVSATSTEVPAVADYKLSVKESNVSVSLSPDEKHRIDTLSADEFNKLHIKAKVYGDIHEIKAETWLGGHVAHYYMASGVKVYLLNDNYLNNHVTMNQEVPVPNVDADELKGLTQEEFEEKLAKIRRELGDNADIIIGMSNEVAAHTEWTVTVHEKAYEDVWTDDTLASETRNIGVGNISAAQVRLDAAHSAWEAADAAIKGEKGLEAQKTAKEQELETKTNNLIAAQKAYYAAMENLDENSGVTAVTARVDAAKQVLDNAKKAKADAEKELAVIEGNLEKANSEKSAAEAKITELNAQLEEETQKAKNASTTINEKNNYLSSNKSYNQAVIDARLAEADRVAKKTTLALESGVSMLGKWGIGVNKDFDSQVIKKAEDAKAAAEEAQKKADDAKAVYEKAQNRADNLQKMADVAADVKKVADKNAEIQRKLAEDAQKIADQLTANAEAAHANADRLAQKAEEAAKNLSDLRAERGEVDAAREYAKNLRREANKTLIKLNAAKKAVNNLDIYTAPEGILNQLKQKIADLTAEYNDLKNLAEAADKQAEEMKNLAEAAENRAQQLAKAEEARRRAEENGAGDSAESTSSPSVAVIGGTTVETPVALAASLPTGAEVAPAGVAGARTSAKRTGSVKTAGDGIEESGEVTGNVVEDNEGTIVAENNIDDADDNVVTIKDEQVPLAAPADMDEAKKNMNWWWLLVVAALGATGYELYKKNQEKKVALASEVKNHSNDNEI